MVRCQSKSRLQFGLRSLFVVSLICAICAYNWQNLLELSFRYFYPFAILVLVAAWWTSQRIRIATIDIDASSTRFSIARVGLPIAVLACLLSLWLRHRWVALFYDPAWPRTIPYPDEIMLVFHNWLDSRYPAEPGYLKMHGEIYTVWGYLNMTVMTMCASVGGTLGFICRKTGPFGTTYWYEKVVNEFRKRPHQAFDRSRGG